MQEYRFTFVTTAAIAILAWAPGCRDEDKPATAPPTKPPGGQAAELIFPDSLRASDEAVNIFVRTALTQCAGGNYESFRALWSARQDPISRGEFEEGWQAVQRIEVRGLQKVLLAADQENATAEPVYVLLVEVALDPAAKAGKREPLREIVLMLTREHDQWRLASAPKDMREWIKEKSAITPNPASPTTIAP